MSLRTFIIGLVSSFGIAWLAVVVIPFFKMRNLEPVVHAEGTEQAGQVFHPKRTGRIATGAEIYAANGCYLCHTQLVRPTTAGNDMFRDDWGGLANDEDRGDTRRESTAWDYLGEDYAHLGVTRMGPDLSNFGRRLEANYLEEGQRAEAWIYAHLYRPYSRPDLRIGRATCPPQPFLFDKVPTRGQLKQEALDVETCDGYQILPGPEVKALASYLMSLKKDQEVPAQLDFSSGQK